METDGGDLLDRKSSGELHKHRPLASSEVLLVTLPDSWLLLQMNTSCPWKLCNMNSLCVCLWDTMHIHLAFTGRKPMQVGQRWPQYSLNAGTCYTDNGYNFKGLLLWEPSHYNSKMIFTHLFDRKKMCIYWQSEWDLKDDADLLWTFI